MNRQNAKTQLAHPQMLSIRSAPVAFVFFIGLQVIGLQIDGLQVVCLGQVKLPEANVEKNAPSGGSDSGETARMKQLLQQLQSERFAERRKASVQLREMGIRAHNTLRQIAESGDSESATRAMDLLKEAARDSDPAIVASARESLEQIAASDNPRAKSADRALRPVNPMPSNPFLGRGQPRIGPQAPRQAQPPVFAPRRRTNLRISIRTTNGIREIEVVENDKKYKFRDAGGGIETQRPDGKGGVKKTTYKNAVEMQKNDPEAFRAYQKAGGSKAGVLGGTIKIQPQRGFGNGFRLSPAPDTNPQPKNVKPAGPRIELHPEIRPPAIPKTRPAPQPKRIEV